jgi:hypothetical protein
LKIRFITQFLEHGLASITPANVKLSLKKHHLYIGASSLVAIICAILIISIPGKSRKVRAGEQSVMEINLPKAPRLAIASPLDANSPLTGLAVTGSLNLAKAEILEQPIVTITNRDGIPVYGSEANSTGILKQSTVLMTTELAGFAKNLSSYFQANKMTALITSAVRTSSRQLDIIKQRITEHDMLSAFPGLADAHIADTAKWISAWQWLKAHHVPVNPPADYVDEDGNIVGGSLHLKGMALDLVADNLDALKTAIESFEAYGTSKKSNDGLRIIGVLREADCVHISLSR